MVRSNRIAKPFLGRHKRRLPLPPTVSHALSKPSETTLKRYIECLTRGRKTGRTAYVLRAWDLPPSLPGAEWTLDHKFIVIDALKTNPELRNAVASVLKTRAPVIEAVKVAQKPSRNPPDNTRIADVDLPTRIQNVLAWNGIATLGQLREMPDKTLLSFQDLGHRSLAFLREYLG
jgi:hypothetical protein